MQERQRIEKEMYEIANTEPLTDEKLEQFELLQKKYKKALQRLCPKKFNLALRFAKSIQEIDVFEATEPRIMLNPLHEGYIVQRVVEITEYHKEKLTKYDIAPAIDHKIFN